MVVCNAKIMEKLKWWQKKVKGWTVPFWYTDTPLCSKRIADMSDAELRRFIYKIKYSK